MFKAQSSALGFKDYLLQNKSTEILKIVKSPDDGQCYATEINFLEFMDADPDLGHSLLSSAETVLKQCNKMLYEVQQCIVNENGDETLSVKLNVNIRIFGLVPCPELDRKTLPTDEDCNSFLQIHGTVARITVTKMLESKRDFECKKCKYITTVYADFDRYYAIAPPKRCKNPQFCKGIKPVLVSVLDPKCCKDYQEIQIQERLLSLEAGTIPNTMWVSLVDDLVGVCKPGDDIIVCGIVKRRWKPVIVGKPIVAELAIEANHVLVNNDGLSRVITMSNVKETFDAYWKEYKDRPLQGRDNILRAFCPEIYGMYLVKLAVCLTLIGGSKVDGDDNRPEPHLLLVGDPGTGKSELLKYAAKVVPRSVFTTGVGTTSAGLTVTAIKDGDQWQLEAGVLVVADGGVACIDEFSSMRKHDISSLHEAMEQQSISVAKAGIVTKFSTRCSVLASMNPTGTMDSVEPLSANVTMASPLLSRFDLVLLVKDVVDKQWDVSVCQYIMRNHKYESEELKGCKAVWPLKMLQAYFVIVKRINPVLTALSHKILSSYYQFQRRNGNRNKARTTVRLLNSLVRLSQAHARLMYRDRVEVIDAVTAITLVESSMSADSATATKSPELIRSFPEDPAKYYNDVLEEIATNLNLPEILATRLNNEDCSKKSAAPPKTQNTETSSSLKTNIFRSTIVDNNIEQNTVQPPTIKASIPSAEVSSKKRKMVEGIAGDVDIMNKMPSCVRSAELDKLLNMDLEGVTSSSSEQAHQKRVVPTNKKIPKSFSHYDSGHFSQTSSIDFDKLNFDL